MEMKPLEWSVNCPPDRVVSYDHCTAPFPFGEIRLEWKGWKEDPSFSFYLNEDYVDEFYGTLDEAKKDVHAFLQSRVLRCLQ